MRVLFSAVFLFSCLVMVQTGLGQMLDRTASRAQTTLDIGWTQLGTIQSKSVGQIKDQNWTLGCETLCRDYIYWDTYKEYVAPLGIRRIRLQGGWAKTEQVKGKYDFAWLDYVIDDARKRGLEVWLETDYGNPIYEGGGGKDLAAGFPTSAEGLAAWDRWVEAMVTRYKDKVWAWAMWNEPDIGKPKKTPAMIVEFNIRTAKVIKKVDPKAKIGALSLATNKPAFHEECLQLLSKNGDDKMFQWVIYHGYPYNPDEVYENVETLKSLVKKYAPHLKLWQGESGCPSQWANRFALSRHAWTELSQAKWDTRRMLGDLGHDVMSSVFTICDFDHEGREINRKGLIKINNKRSIAKIKMAYYSVNNVVSVFDSRLVRQPNYPYSIQCEVPVSLYAYRDAAAGQDLLVFWNATNIPSDDNTVARFSITVDGGKFSDPVWADMISGGIYEIPAHCKKLESGKMILTDIPVYDGPAILTDRSRIVVPGEFIPNAAVE